MDEVALRRLHESIGFGSAQQLYEAAARELRQAGTQFNATTLRETARRVANASTEKKFFHQQTYKGKIARLSPGSWQCDIIDFTPQGDRIENSGYRHVFAAIDIFRRVGFLHPLPSMSVENVLAALTALRGTHPVKAIETDAATSFTDPRVEQALAAHGISLRIRSVRGSANSFAVVDRFIQSIRGMVASASRVLADGSTSYSLCCAPTTTALTTAPSQDRRRVCP